MHSKPRISIFLAITGFLFHAVTSYEVGCIYPQRMLEPFGAREKLIGFTNVYNVDVSLETPIGIHKGQAFSYCDVNCLAHHDSASLNAFSKSRPYIVVPAFGHNSWSRMMCIAQCYAILFQLEGNGEALKTIRDTWILPIAGGVNEEIVSVFGDTQALHAFFEERDYDPLLIGQMVVHEIIIEMREDGWNSYGTKRYGPSGPMPCTSNSCMNYSDTYGYFPRNHPGPHKESTDDMSNYNVTGNQKYWQPLLEDDGLGRFSRQEHVTPHIGYHAVPKLRKMSLRTLEDPSYNFRKEALKVVEQVRESATNRVKWDKISFYDKKFLVRILIERELVKQFQEVMFFEEMLLFIHGISVSEHDAVLQAWREKIRHDIVRPTTVIQTWNDDLITFDGNRESPKVANIKARDFQAFLRVMPHSEYPSGSSCICSAYQEFTDAFTTKYYKGNLTNLRWGPDGVDLGCNEFSTFDEVNAAFYGCKHGGFGILNMKVLAEECGESRLWGGMHFGDSVPAGQQLCSGLGSLGVEYASEIRNGSKFESSHIKGMERPICNTHSTQTPGPTPKFYTKNVAEEFLTYSAASSKQHVSQKLGRGILASILMTFFF